ncbi:hypothetical protein LCGC14_0833000 [marine sediment metagenome]|uniref:Uncharacterized protein n=1 Tax=marine sediment metagenome TaxID=412755 RepID=A0A0F9Q0L9_9ZZZZ
MSESEIVNPLQKSSYTVDITSNADHWHVEIKDDGVIWTFSLDENFGFVPGEKCSLSISKKRIDFHQEQFHTTPSKLTFQISATSKTVNIFLEKGDNGNLKVDRAGIDDISLHTGADGPETKNLRLAE